MIELINMSYFVDGVRNMLEYPHFYLILSMAFFIIASDPRSFYKMWQLFNALEKHEPLPREIADFPVHLTSIEDYMTSQEKVNLFISQSCGREPCELVLSEDDINNLYLHGETIDKYRAKYSADPLSTIYRYSNDYLYFQITGGSIFEKRINYLTLAGCNGIRTETRETRFIEKDSLSITRTVEIEQSGRKLDRDSDWTSEQFRPVCPNDFLLHALFTNDFEQNSYNENESRTHQRNFAKSIIKKITSLAIVDECLIIKIDRPTVDD